MLTRGSLGPSNLHPLPSEGDAAHTYHCLHVLAVDNTSVLAGPDGGRPMMLDGKLVLCSHSDPIFSANGSMSAPGSRHYNGGISKLSIFDTALSPLHVQALHNQVQVLVNTRHCRWHVICIAVEACNFVQGATGYATE